MYHSETRWVLYETETEKVQKMAEELGISPFLAQLLIHRNIEEKEKVESFLAPDLDQLYDPFLLDDMEKAVGRIKTALENKEKITIYGDYDADGVSSTSLLMKALRQMQADVDYYIPNRFTEGYGLNKEALLRIKEQGTKLVVTVDTGISACQEAEFAKEIGLDLIITDHHEPPELLPDAIAVINPKKPNCPYPFKQLAGVGVAFKLISALMEKIPTEWLDLVALGTITDLVPLIDENRILTTFGLQKLNERTNLGIAALADAAGIDKEITAGQIGFGIGPRINACGRLYHATDAVELLLTENRTEAIQLAEMLNQYNQERQDLVEQITEEAIAQIEKEPHKHQKVIVVAQENWHVGVIGIVASRLVEKYYRPTIVLGMDPETGIAKGSARSIEGFDLYRALTACKDLLPHFGGHYMAAGMSLPLENLEPLHRKLAQLAEQWLTAEDYIPLTKIEGKLHLSEIEFGMLEDIRRLEPFGVGNPTPLFQIEQATLGRLQKMGQSHNHLKLRLSQDGKNIEVVAFRRAELAEQLTLQVPIQVVGELTINEWNGRRTAQIFLKDLRVTEPQVFDWRSNRKWERLEALSDQPCLYLLRKTAKAPESWRKEHYPDIVYWEEMDPNNPVSGEKYLVFVDAPPSIHLFEQCLQKYVDIERYYFLFGDDDDDFANLMNVPKRDEFKKLYQTLYQVRDKNVQFPRHLEALSRKTGLSKRTLSFMIQVFEDLSFVSIQNGNVQLQSGVKKRSLQESVLYQRQVDYVAVQQKLIYSSYRELKQYIREVLEKCRGKDKWTSNNIYAS